MSHYLLSVHAKDDGQHREATPADMEAFMARVNALEDDMRSKGVLVFGGGLESAGMSAVIENRNGDAVVTDGPFAEAKEHIAGFYLITADDEESAHEWARRTVEAIGQPIEVRRFHSVSPQ